MLLSFLIPTIIGREAKFQSLIDTISKQIHGLGYIDIKYCKDNKEMSIGAKRQVLLNQCEANYFVMVDDDDSLPEYYVSEILSALQFNPDCVTYREAVMNGGRHIETADHSNKYKKWGNKTGSFDYVRTPFYKDVIKTYIGKKIGFKNIRYGEDIDFANRLKSSGLIVNEVHLNKIMYYYNAPNPLSPKEHNKRYGIR